MVFQAPQASQRPAHFLWDAPQAVQVKALVDFAMPFMWHLGAAAASWQTHAIVGLIFGGVPVRFPA
jgi:hypothetical protein